MEQQANMTDCILVVEDSMEDFVASKRAFKLIGFDKKIIRCENGDEALSYLFRQGNYKDKELFPEPELILLDLNMPGTDGRELLVKIKADQHLKKIPVVIFTTSNSNRDIEYCYQYGANSYIQKPVGFDEYKDSLEKLCQYWFSITQLPTPSIQ